MTNHNMKRLDVPRVTSYIIMASHLVYHGGIQTQYKYNEFGIKFKGLMRTSKNRSHLYILFH